MQRFTIESKFSEVDHVAYIADMIATSVRLVSISLVIFANSASIRCLMEIGGFIRHNTHIWSSGE